MKSKISFVLFITVIFSLICLSNVQAVSTLNPKCTIVSADYVNFSNGTEIFLPFTHETADMNDSNLTIFLGDDTTEFCDTINDSLADYAQNFKIVFTPEFLVAMQSGSCSDTFDTYFDNFKGSGNLTNSSGSIFCGSNGINMTHFNNPDGIYFDFATTADVNVTNGGTHNYSVRNLKRYGLAYIMNNPGITYTGIVRTLAEGIDAPFCGGYANLNAYFTAAKNDYNNNLKDQLLDVNYTAGEELQPGATIPGPFGWLLNFLLGSVNSPIIEAVNLSDNVYLCSLYELPGYNSTDVSLNTSAETEIDAQSTANASLNINVDNNVSGEIEIGLYDENPGSSSYSLTALGRYVVIITNSSELEGNITNVTIKVYYTDAEVAVAGLNESTLRLEYYNETDDTWTTFDNPVGGVDINNNYVWAITDHFSIWGIFGSAPEDGNGGGGDGGSSVSYESLKTGVVVEKTLVKNGIFRFKIDDDKHIFTLQKVYENAVNIKITSTPIETNISLDETKTFDLDDDGFEELSVTLTEILDNKAVFNFELLSETVPSEEAEEAEEEISEELTEEEIAAAKAKLEKTRQLIITYSIIAAIVIIIIALIIIFSVRKHKTGKKHHIRK